MGIVKENIEEENKDINKDQDINKDKDININDNTKDNLKENINININNSINNISNNNNNNDKIDEKKVSDPVISHMNLQGNITEEEINNSSKIIIEEIEGNLFNGEKIEINAGGMVGGRGKRDGFAIFGQKNEKNDENLQKSNNNNSDEDIFKPDYELNYSEHLPYPYIFTIYYKKNEKAYYIRAFSGKGSDNKILFIKLNNEKKYILKRKELISAGNIIFQITPLDNNCLEIINLTNQKYCNKRRVFDGLSKKTITIGRHKECDFFFARDKSFSRYQPTLEFDDNKYEWTVIDGKDNKGSTNGTWVFGIHSFLIENEMIVEILNSKIRIKEIKIDNKNEDEK